MSLNMSICLSPVRTLQKKKQQARNAMQHNEQSERKITMMLHATIKCNSVHC